MTGKRIDRKTIDILEKRLKKMAEDQKKRSDNCEDPTKSYYQGFANGVNAALHAVEKFTEVYSEDEEGGRPSDLTVL